MKDQWTQNVPLVLLPVDDFTGNVIKSPDIHISIPGAARPVIKPDGFWVFPKLHTAFVHATLQGERYQRQTILVDVSALPESNPVQTIRVLPSRAHPFPSGTAYLEGEMPQGATLLAAAAGTKNTLRLRLDCNAGDPILTVFQETRKNLSGRTYLLTAAGSDKDTARKDWVTLTAPADFENAAYHLEKPPAHSYRKMNAVLSPAVTYQADTIGTHYFIALTADGAETSFPVYCRLTAGGWQREAVFPVKAGETVYQNFKEDL